MFRVDLPPDLIANGAGWRIKNGVTELEQDYPVGYYPLIQRCSTNLTIESLSGRYSTPAPLTTNLLDSPISSNGVRSRLYPLLIR